ncbi:sensor histidine kinase [Streptomyces sp. NPDC057011]|uniref:sensor histidine kinase n=1 Tax=unclassified Streptomyces TaxID=2593676 RepID=UPI003635102D
MSSIISRALAAVWRCQLASLAAVAAFFVGAGVIGSLLLLPVGLGRRALPAAAAALRRRSERSRERAGGWSGVRIGPPEPLPRAHRALLAADGFWRDLAWAWLEPLAGGLLVALPLALVEYGAFGVLVQPFVWRLLGDGNWYGFVLVDSTPAMLAALALGLALMVLGAAVAPRVLRLHARWTGLLLSRPRGTELKRRIEELTDGRTEALEAQAAELQRIERDLHDGAQARLVALGMCLDTATRLLERDPVAARAELAEVRALSARALDDLRDLVRGIQPPVLTDRGLGDALRSLALDSFLDVRVEARLPGRLAAPVESAAYFAVNELLANAAKHSGAGLVRITVEHHDARNPLLRVTVTDDGRGGADPSRGTGLLGVRRRLATFDGTLALESPPGGPTTVTLEIPCALSLPKTSSS